MAFRQENAGDMVCTSMRHSRKEKLFSPGGIVNTPMRAALFLAVTATSWALASAAQEGFSRPFRPTVPEGLDTYMPVPEENELTPEKVALGRRLFFDPILSRDATLACATCHDPLRAFTDGREVARGIGGRRGKRNVPTLVNRAYGQSHFFDGRAATLERQALEPITNRDEFDTTAEEVVARLAAHPEYSAMFRAAFARGPCAEDLARAVASYTRTILSGGSPFDRYTSGEAQALNEQEREGLQVFRGKGNCTACHIGPAFSDERFHNTGVSWSNGRFTDAGRAAVSGAPKDRGAFKTPTLREVARTAPYMHQGSLATLEDVIEFYNRGAKPNPYLDPELQPLNLTTEEKKALAAFLRALSGRVTEGLEPGNLKP